MTEEKDGVTTPDDIKSPEDLVKNVKAEFSRKHKEQSAMLDQLMQSQAAIQEALAKMTAPPKKQQVEEDAELENLMYSDPKAYTRRLKEEAKREAMAEWRSESSTQSSVHSKIAQLQAEYPELSDAESELTKASVAILKGASEAERTNPNTYEHAVLKAANALEVKPNSRRKDVEDDFVAPSYQSPQSRSKKRSTDSIINQNKDIAKQFGVNLDDPKQKARYTELLKKKGLI